MSKYEDMILDGSSALARLAGYIGIEPLQRLDEGREKSMFEVHGTSPSPEGSIGRWKAHLSPELQNSCIAEWEDFLAEFAYR